MALTKGDRLGRYEILALLGKGGMGEVHRAYDPQLRRDVAIKTSSKPFDERFAREARAIAAVNHPNICQIYDVGADFLVMELVEGPTLQERIKKQGSIELEEALRIAADIAAALGAAHEKGLIHRDLKPGNVKFTSNGTAKVLDFGLAKFGDPSRPLDSEQAETLSLTLTETGAVMGTPAYMSPEQASGQPVDARTDIWAFGVILYEMLAAKRPFRGSNLAETLASVAKDTPALDRLPFKAVGLIEACLQKDPGARLQAIGDYRMLLRQPQQRGRGWLWPVIAGATGLAAAVLAWIHYREAPVEQPSLRYQLVRPGGARFAHMQVSPDGRNLVYVSRLGTGQGATDKLFVRSLETLEDREFPDSEGALYPFWSPDSTHLAYFSQGKLRQVPVGGGPATEIADVADARGGAWAPDGTIIFAPAVIGGLFRVPALGGTVTPLAKHNAAQQERYSLRFPSFLPDGKHFFFAIESDKSESQGVYVSSLDGGAPVRILPDLSATVFVATPGLSTSGFIFFRRQATLMAQAFDTEQLRTTGEAFVLAGAAPPSGNTGWVDLTATANGTLLYAAGDGSNQERELVWLDRNGKRAGSVLKQKGIKDFAVSRDEKQLLYSLANQSTPGDIYLYDLERGASRRFTFGPSRTYGAVWSPDNATAAFTTYPEDHVYVKNLSAAKEESVPVAGTNSYVSSWSKDGKLLAYSQAGASTKDDLWFLPMDGTRTPRLFKQTPFTERNGQFSPDGLWLAYDSDASGQMEIYVEPSSGGAARQISVAGGFSATWRADGRELYFISNQSVMAVEVTPGADLSFGAPQELFREPTLVPTTIGIAYSPASDGRKFLALLPVGGAPAETLTVVTHWRPNATK